MRHERHDLIKMGLMLLVALVLLVLVRLAIAAPGSDRQQEYCLRLAEYAQAVAADRDNGTSYISSMHLAGDVTIETGNKDYVVIVGWVYGTPDWSDEDAARYIFKRCIQGARGVDL